MQAKLSVLLFFCFVAISTWAQSGLQRATINSTTCSNVPIVICTYQVVNVSIARIPKLINDSLLQTYGSGFIIATDELMVTQKGSQVVFKIVDPNKRAEFISALQFYDTLDNLEFAAPEIRITFKAYAIESSGYENFEMGLSAFSRPHNPLDKAVSRANVTTSAGAHGSLKSGLTLNLGNLTSALFGLNLDLSRLSSWSLESESFETVVTNGENIPGNSSTKTYNKEVSSATAVESADIGFSLSGRVSLDVTGNRVAISNFSVRHASATNESNSIATETLINRGSLILDMDKPYVIGSRSIQLDAKSKGNNFIFAAKNATNAISSNLILVVSASRIKREELAEVQAEADRNKMALESNPSRTLMTALSGIEGFVMNADEGVMSSSLFGQVSGFRLNALSASLELENRLVIVKEKNEITGETIVSPIKVGELVRKGYSFSTIKFSKMQNQCQKRQDGCKIIPVSVQISDDQNPSESAVFSMRYLPVQSEVQVTKANPDSGATKKMSFWRKFNEPNGSNGGEN